MSNENDKPIFSTPVLSWMLAGVVGILLPLVAQDFIAQQFSALSLLPANAKQLTIATSQQQLVAAVILLIAFIVYVMALGFQILFIAKTKAINSVFALVITAIFPAVIWLVLPYFLIALK